MAIISTGQITIIDLYDAPALNAWIGASQNTAQTYNNTTQVYTPDYTSTEQVLTLYLTKAGSGSSLLGSNVSSVKWYKTEGATKTEITSTSTSDTQYKSGTSSSVLTSKVNLSTTHNAARFTVEGIWTDPDTSLPITFQATIDLSLIQLAKASIVGNIYAPNGDFFRNNTPESLVINADLYKDGALSTGSKKYKWFAADDTVTVSQDTDGGVGWNKLTTSPVVPGYTPSSQFNTTITTQGTLTVTSTVVVNAQTIKCVIIDNVGGTSGQKSILYITLKDFDDPIMVVIDSSSGNILKNGLGSTDLSARLFQNGTEIDLGGTTYTYKWTKWENNAMDPNFGGTGKTLTVGNSDVNIKSTFKVTVEG